MTEQNLIGFFLKIKNGDKTFDFLKIKSYIVNKKNPKDIMGKSKAIVENQKFRISTEIVDKSTDIKIEGWLTPKSQDKTKCHQFTNNIVKRVKQTIFDNKDNLGCDEKYLVDLDLRTAGIAYGKMSYFSFQIMLSPQGLKVINIELFCFLMDNMLDSCDVMVYQPYKLCQN